MLLASPWPWARSHQSQLAAGRWFVAEGCHWSSTSLQQKDVWGAKAVSPVPPPPAPPAAARTAPPSPAHLPSQPPPLPPHNGLRPDPQHERPLGLELASAPAKPESQRLRRLCVAQCSQ